MYAQSQRHTFRLVLGLFVVVLSLIGCAAMPGCGPSDEDRVKQVVSQQLDAVKNHDDAFIDAIIGDDAVQSLSALGIDAHEFGSALLDGFDYAIDDVKIEKDTATVTLSITNKSLSSVTASLLDYAKQDAEGNWGGAYLSDDEARSQVAQDALDAIKQVQPTTHDGVTLVFDKTGKTWAASPDVQKTLQALLLQ